MLWQNQPTPEELEAEEKAKQAKVEAQQQEEVKQDTFVATEQDFSIATPGDSLKLEELKNRLGAFAYASSLPSAQDHETLVETDVLQLKFSNKGGYLSEVRLKNFVDYDSLPIYIIKDGNAAFNISFSTTDNRNLNTRDLYFEPTVSKSGENTVVSMKLKVSESKFLEYRYELKPDNYMFGFHVRSQGLNDVFNSSQDINLDWDIKAYRFAKSISYENRYTELVYQYEGGKDDYLGQGKLTDVTRKDVTWVAHKQHFFTSILLADQPFKAGYFQSENLVQDEDIDTLYTKAFATKLPLALEGGEINKSMELYYGPSDYKILTTYDRDLDEILSLGWGIFGWINRYLFMPLFSFLSSVMPYGLAIVVMTILIKLCLSFVQYKQFLSQAKLKIIRPELEAIREKHKDNKLKIQQETMALQSKVGASPLSGCIPALIQIPVFYSLFMFFPAAFDIRQKSFLWAEDLSSYDTILNLPFKIPFYGDHVSLFPILASIAIFIYMKMTTGQQMPTQPTQEGMPDMAKMMKYMIYISPLMMLFFFNNYASGLSLYYFISNLISIGIMLVIKNFILDEDKIHEQIQVRKANPKKQSKFQKRMKEMMEQAAEEQKRRENQKR